MNPPPVEGVIAVQWNVDWVTVEARDHGPVAETQVWVIGIGT